MLPNYVYPAVCVRVLDGDSMHMRADLGFRAALTIPVRVRGIDCPEKDTEAGVLAKEFASTVLTGPGPVTLQSFKDRRSFERWVCDVWVGDRLFADIMVSEGHAVIV